MVGITDGIFTGKMNMFITEKLQIIMYCLLLIKPGFIFKMLPTKQKLHIGYGLLAPSIQHFSGSGRSSCWKKQECRQWDAFFILGAIFILWACHYTISRQQNQESKTIPTWFSFHKVLPTYSLNINISQLSKFKWLIQLRNSWSSIFCTQSCSIQISF